MNNEDKAWQRKITDFVHNQDVWGKVFVAVLALIVGAWLTSWNNRVSAEYAFRLEVAKMRIERAGQVYAEFRKFENAFDNLYGEVKSVRRLIEIDSESFDNPFEAESVKFLWTEYNKQLSNFQNILVSSRYYLGGALFEIYSDLYRKLLYVNELTGMMDEQIVAPRKPISREIADNPGFGEEIIELLEKIRSEVRKFDLNILHVTDIMLDTKI